MSLILIILICIQICHSFVVIIPRHNILHQQTHQTTSIIATTSIQLNAENEKSESSSNDSKEEVEYEWDGVVIEGAHDADFEVNDPTDNFMPSMTLLSMANSVESPIMTGLNFDSIANAGKIHQIEMENGDELNEDNLLEIGGDPDFLDLIAEDNDDNDEESGFFWDGEVDEDAHLD